MTAEIVNEKMVANELDLSDMERKAYRSTFQDGLWDICIGLILLATAISIAADSIGLEDSTRIALYVPVMFLGPALLSLGKKYITEPRLGTVKFGARRMKNTVKINTLIVAAVLISALFVLFVQRGGDYVFTGLILISFSGMAYYFELQRMHLYGIFLALTNFNWIEGEAWGLSLVPLPFLYAMVTLGIGGRLLRNFMIKYPIMNIVEGARADQ